MNIALVVHDFDPRYGQGRYSVELARRLSRDHDVHVYANSFRAGWHSNVTLERVPAWRRGALTSILTFLFRAERILSRRRHDIVHAQGLSCWRADIITAHICNAQRLCQAPALSRRERWFGRLITPFERRFYRQPRARHLIAISRQVSQEIRRLYRWDRPVSVVYHGTDTGQFRPLPDAAERRQRRLEYGFTDRDWVWLFVGQAAKGLGAALSELPAFPEARLMAVSWSNLAPYRTLAETAGVADRVCFRGAEPDVSRAYQAADVFVYPSVYDAFGLVVAEAMATELPVVAGRNTGAAEWIVHGQNGLICDPAEPGSIRRQLEWLRADRSRAAALGVEARRTVMRYSWDECARATVDAYEQTRAGDRPRRL